MDRDGNALIVFSRLVQRGHGSLSEVAYISSRPAGGSFGTPVESDPGGTRSSSTATAAPCS